MFVTLNLLLLFLSLNLASPLSHPPSFQLPFNTSSSSASSLDHSTYDRETYHVPNTDTYMTLHFYEDRPLPSTAVKIVLSNIEVQLTNHIHTRGDGPLQPGDDPYAFGISGCWCSIGSSQSKSLTYRVLRDTVKGLQVLIEGNNYFMAYWDITKGSASGTILGDGVLADHGPDE